MARSALLLAVVAVLASSAVRADDDDSLVDSPKPSALSGPCEAAACAAHCKQQKHAGGRCDEDNCVCQDFKNKGRCAVLGFGCGVNIGGCATCNGGGGGGGPPPQPVMPPPMMPPPMMPPPAMPPPSGGNGKPCSTCGIGGMPFFNANSFVINKEEGNE